MKAQLLTLNRCLVGKKRYPKSEISHRCNLILNRYPRGQNIDWEHAEFMLAVFELRSENEIKGNLVSDIFVDRDDYGGRCFWIRLTDGTTEPFSYHFCISGKHKIVSLGLEFTTAARNEVASQTIAFKESFFASRDIQFCPIDDTMIHIYDSVVDHVAPATFNKLLRDFVQLADVDVERCEFKNKNHRSRTFKDRKLAASWQRYHSEFAVLRVISEHQHRKLSAAQQRKK